MKCYKTELSTRKVRKGSTCEIKEVDTARNKQRQRRKERMKHIRERKEREKRKREKQSEKEIIMLGSGRK